MLTGVITVWFILTALSALFVTYDLLTNTPAMGVMKPGWVLVVLLSGYFFGNIPVVRRHFTLVIMAIIVISVLPAIIEALRHARLRRA